MRYPGRRFLTQEMPERPSAAGRQLTNQGSRVPATEGPVVRGLLYPDVVPHVDRAPKRIMRLRLRRGWY